jgi:hypothetical protein
MGRADECEAASLRARATSHGLREKTDRHMPHEEDNAAGALNGERDKIKYKVLP